MSWLGPHSFLLSPFSIPTTPQSREREASDYDSHYISVRVKRHGKNERWELFTPEMLRKSKLCSSPGVLRELNILLVTKSKSLKNKAFRFKLLLLSKEFSVYIQEEVLTATRTSKPKKKREMWKMTAKNTFCWFRFCLEFKVSQWWGNVSFSETFSLGSEVFL